MSQTYTLFLKGGKKPYRFRKRPQKWAIERAQRWCGQAGRSASVVNDRTEHLLYECEWSRQGLVSSWGDPKHA